MATSEILLEETPYLHLTTRGRKTGLKHDVELWFAFDDYKLYFLAHESSHWWKNIARTPRVEVEVSEILFEGKGRLVQGKLDHVLELFRRKYGGDQVERWYSGNRSKRRAIEIELGRVLGKRPSGKFQFPKITI
ncbi:MAG TPA: nitroreductase/quinone reductase family protein [Candidatus Dormibacteraeota bacterium]|nr:nitroreductase/quinone reductase family protein [Candidatus Dormibacteraeota bacterium]